MSYFFNLYEVKLAIGLFFYNTISATRNVSSDHLTLSDRSVMYCKTIIMICFPRSG
jgi:hypothetical protein